MDGASHSRFSAVEALVSLAWIMCMWMGIAEETGSGCRTKTANRGCGHVTYERQAKSKLRGMSYTTTDTRRKRWSLGAISKTECTACPLCQDLKIAMKNKRVDDKRK